MLPAASQSPVQSPAPRHVPERSCVACRRRRPQAEFIRLVKVAGLWTQHSGVRSGRGAYLCADTPGCWAEKRLRRTFGAQASQLSAQLLAASSPSHAVPTHPTSSDPTFINPTMK